MFSRPRKQTPAPLTGAPAVRRQKTYSAQSGYAYLYYYEGRREAERERERGTEFVFDVSAGRAGSFPASVFVGEAALDSWQANHGRRLAGNERYAIAKMALFQAFDERPSPADFRESIVVRPGDVETILETLGID